MIEVERVSKRFGPLTGSQWTALTVVLLSIAVWANWAISKRAGPTTPSRTEDRAEEAATAAADPGAT